MKLAAYSLSMFAISIVGFAFLFVLVFKLMVNDPELKCDTSMAVPEVMQHP